ncbi:polyphosphate kinase 2 [Terrihabitans rhizophilus]|uniref:ADP/GDP-polyphosphate phosphotransferase n=1 Tax=Terrihabitans rhizophilus TaxID=3092662 RepID=A0ABU4RIL6_9HYPH|nr:polyphosphate kinase 2 [Terrihabitans sp. PJ23]MDX6804657.1 polyphosphate kinase 2 [Terrihabitans sp. PJ23]
MGADLYPGPDVEIDGIHVDLDDPALPKVIEDRAFASGGFPYEKKLKKDVYEPQLIAMQIELLKLQNWAKQTGARVVIVFEGRDSAGKGGTIQRFTEHLNPRSARVVALSKPSETERGQWYFQRYLEQMPTAGEIVLFDRSWYNRAVVEPVMGFATSEQTEHFMRDVPTVEKMLVDDGIHLFKLWLTVGREMQVKRLFDRRHDPLKRWKLSPIDYDGLPLWDAYTVAAEHMLRRTHTDLAPWTVIRSNDKNRARLEAIRTVLRGVNYDGKDMDAVGVPDPLIVADAATFLTKNGQI